MADSSEENTGEQREQEIPRYPDNVAGERQAVRNFQIESGQNRIIPKD